MEQTEVTAVLEAVLFAHAELFQQQEMPGGGHGQELSRALHQPENDGFPNAHITPFPSFPRPRKMSAFALLTGGGSL